MPGRELANVITTGMRRLGFHVQDVSYEEPFFSTRCRSGTYEYEILSFVGLPDKIDATWVVECRPVLGLLSRLMGRSEEQELEAVLKAIHEVLTGESRVTEIRWFKTLPSDPFRARKYWSSPTDSGLK